MTGFPQPSMPGFPPGPPGYGQAGPQGYGPRGPADDQMWSLLAYLLGFVASILAPLIIFLVKMNESRYVRYHAAQALNMGITAVIYAFGALFVALALAVGTHGYGLLILIPVYLVLGIAHLVYLILAAIGAHRGELYRVPAVLCFRMIR
jgi:uncharacterized Tic20 family protein